jgi:hypothetical protein
MEGLAAPPGEIGSGSDLNDETAELQAAIEEYFINSLQAADRSVLFLSMLGDAKVRFEKLSETSVDAAFSGYESRLRDKIRMAHRIPPAALGIIETANLGSGSSTSQLERYRDHIVAPGQRMLAAMVNTVILRAGLLIPYFVFRFKPMEVQSATERSAFLLKEYETGGVTLNEYRKTTGRQKFEGAVGNSVFIRNAQISIVGDDGIETTMPGQHVVGEDNQDGKLKPAEPEQT